jgi:alkanesulfonate monooxygenase SsuD/methylene tetrahydromethanopterin reductase-like flavin-dependent oxidoreductase (luciferase family)
MKLGILQFFSWPGRRQPIPIVYARALERIAIMDQGGYDAVWITEHHFNDYSVCPSIPVMGAYAASRTRRLRIGTGVTLAAFYNPLRLAEDIALLDILSGGRVNWGAGRGFDRNEFKAFGVTMEESAARFHETVEVVLKAWRSDRLSHTGRYFSFEDVEVLPKPLQQPHPPVFVAAGSPASFAWAASRGYSVLMGPHATDAQMGAARRNYLAALTDAGHSATGRETPMARLLAIASTDAEAERIARQGAKWLLDSYIDPKVLSHAGNPLDWYVDSVVIHGTPERVTDRIAGIRDELGFEYLIGAPLSHETFLAFTDKVVPKLV